MQTAKLTVSVVLALSAALVCHAQSTDVIQARIDILEAKLGRVRADLAAIERELYDAVNNAAAMLDDDANVDVFLSAFAPIVPVIQRFFEEVLVNADDQTVRENRLGLLQAVAALAYGYADLSELAGF